MKLARRVVDGTFRPSYHHQKTISERGKIRVIRPPKFECKVVQKVLCDYMLRSALEPRMIWTSYASIRGRGPARMYADILRAFEKKLANGEMTEEAIRMQAKSVIGSMKRHPNNKKQVARVEGKLKEILGG